MKGKIILAFFFALLALTLIGLVGQSTLTQLITSIKKESQPNQKLTSLKEILADLSVAESSVRTYTITQETENLTPFFQSVTSFDNKMQALYNSIRNKDQMKLADSMENMIGKKYIIMKRLIDIKKDQDTNKVLQRVLDNISKLRVRDSVPQPIETEAIADGDVNSDVIEKVEIPEPQPEKKKKTLFQRIFGKNDEEKDEITDVENISADNEPVSSAVASSDSLPGVSINEARQTAKDNDLNSREIGMMINKIGKEETRSMEAVRKEELTLTTEDNKVMQEIRNLANQFEAREKTISLNRAEAAQKATDKAIDIMTITWISALSIFAVLLFIIFNDISKNQKNKNRLRAEKERAEKLAKVKEQFLSNMSHEIRTPMNSIIGFTEQLESTPLDHTQKNYLHSIQHSGSQLLRLINDILDYSKLESGQLPMESIGFQLRESVVKVNESFKNLIKEKRLRIHQEIDDNVPEVVIGDPLRFEQILINLLSNAIKFTPSGDINILLKLDKLEKNEVYMQLTVSDSGIGIPKNKLNSIFNDFAQVDSSITRKYGGTGLGLSIIKKIVNMQGGRISVNSEEGKGTTFIIHLKYQLGKRADLKELANRIPIDYQKLANKKVMVVDDQDYNLELIKVIFGKWKIRGTMVGSGSAALHAYETEKFDLIFMDVQMPEMSGLEVTQKIRKIEKNTGTRTPVIALTAATSQEEAQQCIHVGMDGYLLKPFKQLDLYNKLVEFISFDTPANAEGQNESSVGQLNIHELEQLSNGDSDFIINMLRIFIKNFSIDLGEMQKGIAGKNWNVLKSKAHKMIPPCRHLGFTHLVDILKTIEAEAIKSQNFKKEVELVNEIVTLFKEIKPEIEREISKVEKEKSETTA